MAQAAVEIIQDYQKQVNGEKFADISASSDFPAGQLPTGIVLEEIDTKCLSLPFPVEAVLPTMRLVFETMGNKVRYAMSDKQVNSIVTGIPLQLHISNNRRRFRQTSPQPT